MAIKPFNSVGGYSVGPNLTPFLNADNDANVANLTVNGTFGMTGNVSVGNLAVTGQSNLNTLNVANAAVFNSTANVTGILSVTANIDGAANLNVTNNAVIGGTLRATGATTLDNTLLVSGAANIDNTLRVGGDITAAANAAITGTLGVTGLSTLANANVTSALNVGGAATFAGATTITSAGSLDVQGATTISNTVTVTGTSVALDNTSLTSNGTVAFSGSNVALGAAANLKITGGSNGQYLRTLNDATGAVEWATVDTDTLANGTSNVDIPVADGPVRVGVGGTANVAVFTTTGLNVTSNITATSTVTADTFFANTLANVAALEVRADANIAGAANITGATEVGSTLTVADAILGQSYLDIIANASIGTDLTVGGEAVITGNANVTGAINGTTMALSGNAAIGGEALVTGNANVTGNINGSTINLTGNANIVTDLLVGGKANIAGTANIVGAANLGSTLGVAGISTFAANVAVTGAELSFVGSTGATGVFTTSLNTANLTANALVTLGTIANVKIAGGTQGQVLTAGATAGDLVWSSSPNVTQIVNGTSSVAIPATDGNVEISVNGQANIITVQSNGTAALTTIVNDVVITGNLIVDGTTTEINTTTFNVEDPVITEGRGANNTALTTNDGKDRGLYSWYFNGSEKAGFIGYKNAGQFSGKYIIANEATLASDVVTATSYAGVVVGSIIGGADTTGNTAIVLNAANVTIGTGSTANVLTVTEATITSEANVVVNGDIDAVGGNVSVQGAATGDYGSQIDLLASNGGATVTTSIGSGSVVGINSATPTAIVTIPDVPGRTVEFFVSARATNNTDFEAAKYLVVSDGASGIDNTVYGTVRVGVQAQQVDVTFARVGSNLVASVALAAGVTGVTYQFSTQYQIIA